MTGVATKLTVACFPQKKDFVSSLVDQIVGLIARDPSLFSLIAKIIRDCREADSRLESLLSVLRHAGGASQGLQCSELLRKLYSDTYEGWAIDDIRAYMFERLVCFIERLGHPIHLGYAVFSNGAVLEEGYNFCPRTGRELDIITLQSSKAELRATEYKVRLSSYISREKGHVELPLFRQLIYMGCIEQVATRNSWRPYFFLATFEEDVSVSRQYIDNAGFSNVRILSLSNLRGLLLSPASGD